MSVTPMTRLPSEQVEALEEGLSELYECREENLTELPKVQALLDKKVQANILSDLQAHNLVAVENGHIRLTPAGDLLATRVIRRKRLAERLLKDVLNLDDEHINPAACQWEHILSQEVTNSICTLLGHPSQSPDELPIPPGECCRVDTQEVAPVITSLDRLSGGDRGKITYLLLKRNPDLHRLLSLGMVPGTEIEILQKFPTYVVQLNESQLAFDRSIAEAIFVHPLSQNS